MEIKLNNVNYTVNKNKTIIDNLNINIKDNSITSIIGPTGSGKTTLAKLISLFIKPTNGQITFDNIVVTNQKNKENLNKLRPNIGLVYQNPKEQFFLDTVKKEIEFTLDNLNYKTKDKQKRIEDSLKLVGLNNDILYRNPNTLSNGEQRKLSLAIALSFNPKILILDEPTLELDEASKRQLVKLIKIMKLRYKKTIIIFSKDTDFVHAISDYIYVFNNSKIVLEGNKYEVFTNTKILKQNHLKKPNLIEFVDLVENKKNVKIGYRDDINDLMKDVYRYVR